MSDKERAALRLQEAKEKKEVPGEGWTQDRAPSMKCGCTADGKDRKTGKWCCVVHDCDEEVTPPDLTDRIAKCTCCGRMRLSSHNLPFFHYNTKDDGSDGTVPIDEYYCGCRGWD